MNSRDLTLSAIDGTPEKIPFNPFIMHLAASLIDMDYSREYCQNAEELAAAQVNCAQLFEINHVNVSTDAFREASAWGIEIDFSLMDGTSLMIDEIKNLEQMNIDLNNFKEQIITENSILITVFYDLPMLLRISKQHENKNGFTKIDILKYLHNDLRELYRNIDPYNESGAFGFYFEELKIKYSI